ncbi:hypothetical protein MC7420_4335 [Coleofasciculus chthonoplastes PCC 7420]|uniref:Uncharacterized protein n=1 Tax=Coleofasciculus chthonoplastes PCC 7420 TaxID=118168 RepID=B4W3Y1_9CYAN|nr:hypothetical protein MC7420_4335 [Coleofasciculus chthonoplastes PCC 7420]
MGNLSINQSIVGAGLGTKFRYPPIIHQQNPPSYKVLRIP